MPIFSENVNDMIMVDYKPPIEKLASKEVQFYTFFHPFVCSFVESMYKDGLDGLLTLENQLQTLDTAANETYFEETYDPGIQVNSLYPLHDLDFEQTGTYSQYRLFFHIPMLIATRWSTRAAR